MKRRYSFRKILLLAGFLAMLIAIFAFALSSPKGKTEDLVPIPPLTKEESNALRKYNNTYHVAMAKAKGLKTPISSNKGANQNEKSFKNLGLVIIEDNKYYEIPHLSTSLPYLKPQAVDFLDGLGKAFCNRLEELEMTTYRFSVTSILRTLEDQKSLRKNNVNATSNDSSHYYGLTFDLSQTRFFERGNSKPVYSYRLRNILLRELIKMQKEGKCYVLLESQTKCIHVTVR